MQKGDFRTMTVRDAAGALGVSTQRVYALLKEGKLDGVRLPKGQMVYERSVERRLEGNES
jgi:excisionase family DNA binding protein